MGSRSSLALSTVTLVVVAQLAAPTTAAAQAATYDLAEIMRGYETVGREPGGVQWTADSRWIYFSWLPAGSAWSASSDPYRVRAQRGASPERVTRAHMDSMAPVLANGPTTRDGRRRAVAARGDLWLVELPSGVARRLTNTAQTEQLIGWSADDTRIFYRTADNAFALRVRDGYIEQLTDFRAGPAPDTARRTPPQRTALERDQRDLLQVIRDRAAADSVSKVERAARDSQALRPVYLGRDERQRGMWVAPIGSHLLFVAVTDGTTKPTQVPAYVTASGYTEEIPSRTKVGDALGRSRLGLLDIDAAKVRWITPITGDSGGVGTSINVLGWNDAGTSALLSMGGRDNTTRAIARLDVADGKVTPLLTQLDSAWVGGPCGNCAGWLPGDAGIWTVSEADGYAHLYVMRTDGSEMRQLTSGKWEVRSVRLSPRRDRFELQTSETSPHDNQFYTMALSGGPRSPLTPQPGLHQVSLSPDGAWLADIHSTANAPAELFLRAVRGGDASRLTVTPSAEWRARRWLAPEIVAIPASDGVMVPARIYRPEELGAAPNGAAVLFVHGAGYLQNVHNGWSSYFREYQFHHLLASKGYVVLDVDYRASAGYGRDWRAAVYRHMGGRDLEDFVDASKWLTATRGINPERIGIYGGSYGGFITLMALFTRPQFFGAGAALRSVTDWAHYNHGYTSNILNEPQTDTLAYRQSSPIFFAEGLEDPLLIAHGMIDTNVHFQDVVRLSQRLIELGKTRWELAVYPVEDHGFVRPDSWTDEYRRILDLFDRWLPTDAAGPTRRE